MLSKFIGKCIALECFESTSRFYMDNRISVSMRLAEYVNMAIMHEPISTGRLVKH